MARRRRSRKRTSCSNFVFSDVWNMCLLEYKQYGEKCNTRKMHTVSMEVSSGKLRIRYHVHNLPRSHCELPKEVEVFCHQQILDLNQCMVSLANLGPPSCTLDKKQRMFIRLKDGNCAFYLLPFMKRDKEVLFKRLMPD